MTLLNLLKIQSLIACQPRREDIQRLLSAAQRNLSDAAVMQISDENRFDAAYKCIMQCAMASLHAHGYRTAPSKPGHHQVAIQTLPLTVGLMPTTMVILDGLRKQRNVSDYDGEPVSRTSVDECIKQAQALLDFVRGWLTEHHPEFCDQLA
jgi:hypothetical protein